MDKIAMSTDKLPPLGSEQPAVQPVGSDVIG